MKRILSLGCLLAALFSPPASAILDTQPNGMSDLWERAQNGGDLYTNMLPGDDDDGDGWTNEQEATAGTNPKSSLEPDGFLRPEVSILHDVPFDFDNDGIAESNADVVASIAWPIIAGKSYTLLHSTSLAEGSWSVVETKLSGINGTRTCHALVTTTNGVPPTDPKMFWRIKIEDVDTDGDGLTNAEELALNPPTLPEVILSASVAYTTAEQATLTASVSHSDGLILTSLRLNGQTLSANPGISTHTVNLANGPNVFTLVATDNAGQSSSAAATITRDNGLPQLAITNPIDSSTIEASSIDVLGTVGSAIPLRSVTVNGVSAYINGGTFEAPNLAVVDGANTFTATATDILGKVATVSITATGQPPVQDTSVEVTATPSVGTAPLNVTFNVVANVPGTIQQVTYDFEGSGKNLVTTTAIAPLAHVYSETGTFYPRITICTTLGTFSNKTGPSVPVTERLRVAVTGGGDGPLVAWSNLKRSVAAGDFEAAGETLSESHRDGLKAMMVLLGPELASTMLNNFEEPDEISLEVDEATYAAEISTPEGVITFLVDCIKENGQWKVNSF